MPVKKKKPRKNGLVLTAKNLDPASYNAIHELPHGLRRLALHAILAAAGDLAARDGKEWFVHGKKLKLSYGRD